MEHRSDLEAVRSRHRGNRALRLSLCDGVSSRPSASARRCGARQETRCDPSRQTRDRRERARWPGNPCVRRRHHRGRRCADRCRRRAFAHSPRFVRRRSPALLRHDRLARRDPDRARAATDQPRQGHQLDRRRRSRGALPVARRQAHELRRHPGAHRLARRISGRPKVRSRSASTITRAGIRMFMR